MKHKNKVLQEILLKLANGFEYTETITEYAPQKDQDGEQELVLIKKKISSHFVPPDMLAIKMLLEDNKKIDSFSSMTDEELVALKNKLISQIVGGDKKCK